MTAEHQVPKSITALSVLSGIPEEEVAVQVACLFSAIGGPHAAINTLGDEFQPIGFDLLHLGGDSPRQSRLVDLMFQPLRFIQEDLLEFSRLASAEHLDWMSMAVIDGVRSDERLPFDPNGEEQEKTARRDTYRLANMSSEGFSLTDPCRRRQDIELYVAEHGCEPHFRVDGIHNHFPHRPKLSETYLGRREGRCLYEPLVFLDNPGPKTLGQSWDSMDRQSPLILDETGRLWEHAHESAAGRKMVKEVFGVRISHRPAPHAKDRFHRRCPHLFSVATDRLGSRLLSDPKLENLLSGSVITTASPRGAQEGAPDKPESIGTGYHSYRVILQHLVSDRRRDDRRLWSLPMPGEVKWEFHLRQRAFMEKLESIDSEQPAFLAAFAKLPASLLWTVAGLDPKKEVTSEQVATALYFAESAVRNHLDAIRSLRLKSESEKIQRQAAEMLRKLFRAEPCSLRDLLRKYDVQRRDVHEPVLNHLVETGKVMRLESNQYRLTEAARAELAVHTA